MFRLRTAWTDIPVPHDPDTLWITLDALGEADHRWAELRPEGADRPYLRCVAALDGRLTVAWDDGAGPHRVTGADLLATHAAIRACLAGEPWSAALTPLQDTADTAPDDPDYAATGLSVASAVLDSGRRLRRRGRPSASPPVVRWSGRVITTGDVWREPPERGRLRVRVLRRTPGLRQGIAIAVPGGVLTCGPASSGPELVLWPAGGNLDFEVDFLAPERLIRVCHVYQVAAGDHIVTDRWSENAAMWISDAGPNHRRYHCNHAATDPPAFTDLVFAVTLV